MSNLDPAQQNADPSESPLSIETLVEKVHSSFNLANRERIPRELIEQTLSTLDLSVIPSSQAAPRLTIERVIFEGEKKLRDESNPQPFRYDQHFQPGVNILLVSDNSVGKSSVMKTIKFALTGDDSDYELEVKSWIHQIWLQFSIGHDRFTIYINRSTEKLRGILVFGEEERRLETLSERSNYFFDAVGSDNLRERLQQFFFERFDIRSLNWTHSSPGFEITMRNMTWKTFFQAMLLPDSSHDYLLCDSEHAIGNQEGLILSTFLGLRLVEPINQLLVSSKVKKQEHKLSDDQVQQAEAEINSLTRSLLSSRREAELIRQEQRARFKAFQEGAPAQRVREIDARALELANAVFELDEQIIQATREIKRSHATAKNLREAINYKLNLTGLEVTICPNCDADVEEQSIVLEQQTHACRLCRKPAKPASPEAILKLNAQALYWDQQASSVEQLRSELSDQLKQLYQEQENLDQERRLLVDIAAQGYEGVALSAEEEAHLANLYQQSGTLEAQIARLKQILTTSNIGSEEAELAVKAAEKCREILRREAEKLNSSILQRLSAQTHRLAEQFGTESITDISCSSVGKLKLWKHGMSMPFTAIHNSGERLRVRLAFFIAMMRIGREPGIGRHPGFLLIDQIASSEMVEDDCRALATTLRQLDQKYYKEVQVICFTARSEFEQATDPSKIYGTQAGKYVF